MTCVICPETTTENLTVEQRILQALRRIMRGVDLHSRQLQARCGLTMPQLICLQALRGLGQAPLSTLAKQIHLGSPTVLGIVDRLEEKGLLCRERSRQDRRKVLIELTEEGRSLLDRTPSLLQDRLSHSLNLLEPLARQQIASSLENIVHMMGMDHLDAAPHLLPHAEIESEANQDPRSEH